jgi:RNA polymerase sigma-70 factor (ECF subfamily)
MPNMPGLIGQNLRNTLETVGDDPRPEIVRDNELLAEISQKNRDALSHLYDHYSSVLYATAVRILNDTNEAEDVVQETILIIWEKAATYHPHCGSPFAWIVTILRNKAIERLRSSQRRARNARPLDVQRHDPIATAPELMDGDESSSMRTALGELPADQRQAIELAYFDGLTQQEISHELKQPLGTIKARIRRGLLKLRSCLGVSA